MDNVRSIPITVPVPFLPDRTVLFVDGAPGTLSQYIEKQKDEYSDILCDSGYSFLFLPDLVSGLSPEMLSYFFPGCDGQISVEEMYGRIRSVTGLGDEAGFLYKARSRRVFFCTVPDSPEEADAVISDLASMLAPPRIRMQIVKKETVRYEERAPEYSIHYEPSFCEEDIQFSLTRDEEEAEEPDLDARTQSIIDAWNRLAAEYGITIEELAALLNYQVKLSHLRITTSNRIFLSDLEGSPEVKMDDLTKALFFFYLRHPEGAAFKELADYEDDVYHIYSGITGRDDLAGIKKSVASLVDPYSSCRNSCVSRIKKAFRDIVGDRIAQFYYISGPSGGTRSILIDRDLVIWEH